VQLYLGLFSLSLFKMNRLQKHIAGFLLMVFILGVIPAPLFHELFANHTDVADNHCRYFHKDLGRHIEQQQNHCDIFKTDTPLYDAVKVGYDFKLSLVVISEYKNGGISSYSFAKPLGLPSRAPPLA